MDHKDPRHIEGWSIWDGAQDEERIFPWNRSDLYRRWALGIIADAEGTGAEAQVYSIYHPHSIKEDCGCVQYLTSHLPDFETLDEENPHATELGLGHYA